MLRSQVIKDLVGRKRKSMRVKMKRRRDKDKDRFAMTKTGESPLHPWFTRGKASSLLKEVQRLRNMNRHNIKYNSKLMKDYVQTAEEYSMYRTHKYYADHKELTQNLFRMKEVEQDIPTLPAYLQKELQTPPKKFEIPESLSFLGLYESQLTKALPAPLATNLVVMKRIKDIAEDRIPFYQE